MNWAVQIVPDPHPPVLSCPVLSVVDPTAERPPCHCTSGTLAPCPSLHRMPSGSRHKPDKELLRTLESGSYMEKVLGAMRSAQVYQSIAACGRGESFRGGFNHS